MEVLHHEEHEGHEERKPFKIVDRFKEPRLSVLHFLDLLRALRVLRGEISLCVLFNDPRMLYCDEPERAVQPPEEDTQRLRIILSRVSLVGL
jgi:hypothetical protein